MKSNQNKSRISAIWLILVFFALIASSCTPSVVRTSNSHRAAQQKNATPNRELAAENKVQEFEEMLARNVENKNLTVKVSETSNNITNNERILPTLQEQMQKLSEEQVVINNRVNTLQNDVIELKYAIEEMKTALNKNQELQRKPVVAGEPIAQNNTEPPAKQNNNHNMLLSDEAAAQKPVAKRAEPKPKSNVNRKPVASNTNKQPVINNIPLKETDEKSQDAVEDQNEIDTAKKLFESKKFNQAILKFNEIISESKDDDEIAKSHFYIGESQIALNNFEQAISHFTNVIKSTKSNIKDDATAKIAECLLKMGQTGEAKSTFQKLINNFPQSRHVPIARKLLQQM